METGNKKYGDFAKNDNDAKTLKDLKYHSGLVPFVFYIIIFIMVSLVSIFALKKAWYDGLMIASVVSFSFNVLWLISRQKMGMKLKFEIKKVSKKIKFDYILFNNPNDKKYAENNIDTFEDYESYFDKKISYTKIYFWLSFVLHLLLVITFMIISILVWKDIIPNINK